MESDSLMFWGKAFLSLGIDQVRAQAPKALRREVGMVSGPAEVGLEETSGSERKHIDGDHHTGKIADDEKVFTLDVLCLESLMLDEEDSVGVGT